MASIAAGPRVPSRWSGLLMLSSIQLVTHLIRPNTKTKVDNNGDGTYSDPQPTIHLLLEISPMTSPDRINSCLIHIHRQNDRLHKPHIASQSIASMFNLSLLISAGERFWIPLHPLASLVKMLCSFAPPRWIGDDVTPICISPAPFESGGPSQARTVVAEGSTWHIFWTWCPFSASSFWLIHNASIRNVRGLSGNLIYLSAVSRLAPIGTDAPFTVMTSELWLFPHV